MTDSRILSRPVQQRPHPRTWQRISVSLPADLFSLEGERSALVINLCTGGAMVELPLPPRIGSEVTLHCGGIEAEGMVVWQDAQHCGIQFHHPVDPGEIDTEVSWSRTSLARMLAG